MKNVCIYTYSRPSPHALYWIAIGPYWILCCIAKLIPTATCEIRLLAICTIPSDSWLLTPGFQSAGKGTL